MAHGSSGSPQGVSRRVAGFSRVVAPPNFEKFFGAFFIVLAAVQWPAETKGKKRKTVAMGGG
jgi:hypothetical protein